MDQGPGSRRAPFTMQVQIKFTKPGASSVFGNFAPGDLLRCSAEQARHFVRDAQCAVYVDPDADKQPVEEKPTPRKRKTVKD